GDEAALFFASSPAIARDLAPLQQVGLGYLRLGQPTSTLSGGEAQRLRLAAFLAAPRKKGRRLLLFDEPTTGLHARDVARLLDAFDALVARGDSILVVEHHLDLIRAAAWVIELGPGPGEAGGKVVYEGAPDGLLEPAIGTATAKALRERTLGGERGRRSARARGLPSDRAAFTG
ncbi:MAG: excinuclease ABC subunit A, partial [Candidatus Eisenbacteria bacterium]|nr:excinuclease ABC subunit A [Candidatus Eisenbacteria bacterium]